jgi:hypothetical protein
MESLINEEKDLIFETKPELFSIGTITILDETVTLFECWSDGNHNQWRI